MSDALDVERLRSAIGLAEESGLDDLSDAYWVIVNRAYTQRVNDGRASAEPRPDSGIDVERLAEALHESDLMRRYSEYADAVPTMTPTPEHTLCIEWAAIIAREYARLSTPRTETSDGLLDAERDALL